MPSRRNIAIALALLLPAVALVPLGLVAFDWARLSLVTSDTAVGTVDSPSFDWIVWADEDELITAAYVFPRGPAAEAGLRSGDVFYMLNMQQYFSTEVLKTAVEGIGPGEDVVYTVFRGGEAVRAKVRLTAYPTFLYPISARLWNFSRWGFTLAAFIHFLGLIIAIPLAVRSRYARSSLILIFVSALWIIGNTVRLFALTLLGPPIPGSTYATVFQALTLVGLVGWIGFPFLLVRTVAAGTDIADSAAMGAIRPLLVAPATILAALAIVTGAIGHFGPLTLDRMVSPILFYACCYLALAACLALLCYTSESRKEAPTGSHSRVGNGIMLLLAALAAMSVLGIVPVLDAVTESTAGWFVIAAQLLSTVPVILVSVTTLRYGRIDRVFARSLTYLTVLGLIFFAFVGGMGLLDPLVAERGWPRNIVAGSLVVMLLLVFERVARHTRSYFTQFFATDRERAARLLDRFQESTGEFIEIDTLLARSIEVVGKALSARSAVVFVRPSDDDDRCLTASYHPEPPYLTERIADRVWLEMRDNPAPWAANAELGMRSLSTDTTKSLIELGAVVIVPLRGRDRPMGLLALGRKTERRAVYNLEDVDRLRSFAGHLAIAIERLMLVERQQQLIRETSDAQLRALRAQINPHFLFNALNTIVASIDERPDLAEATVENLSSIFRYILQTEDRPFVPLREELLLVRHYLDIEKARFGDKLRVEIAADDDTLDVQIPAFVVQTLVENAVKHGLERTRDGGRVSIACQPAPEGIQIQVVDSGVGIPTLFDAETDSAAEAYSFFGIGLNNIMARLGYLYGRTDLMSITSAPGVGTTVTIVVPGSTMPEQDAGTLRVESAR
ncbi:MAG: histidine kinase [Rhodothermales bacterium]|nr:histidine kinase [Rhodothermales bacterium]